MALQAGGGTIETCREPRLAKDSRWPSSTTAKRMGAWLADIATLPGVTAYGRTRKQATAAVHALALRLIADRLEPGADRLEDQTFEFQVGRQSCLPPAFSRRPWAAACRRSRRCGVVSLTVAGGPGCGSPHLTHPALLPPPPPASPSPAGPGCDPRVGPRRRPSGSPIRWKRWRSRAPGCGAGSTARAWRRVARNCRSAG